MKRVPKEELAKQHEPGWQCPECKLTRGADLCDPCIGKLPGVLFACCGHGGKTPYDGYIYFENGVIVRFDTCTVERTSPERLARSTELRQVVYGFTEPEQSK